eukprot:tig00000142_g8657.t1
MGHAQSAIGRAFDATARTVFKGRKIRVVMVGLDSGGKSTVLYRLKLGEIVTTIPTIGFNVEEAKADGVTVTSWDISTRGTIRPLWRYYFNGVAALIYVVDATDRDRLAASLDELFRVLSEVELEQAVLTVFCNKRDVPRSMTGDELRARMEEREERQLRDLRGRPWRVFETVATTGAGIKEALEWTADAVARQLAAEQGAAEGVGGVQRLTEKQLGLPPLVARGDPTTETAAQAAQAIDESRRRTRANFAPGWFRDFEASNGKTDGQLREDFEQGRLTYDTLGHGTMIRVMWMLLSESAAERAEKGQGRRRAVDAILGGVEAAHRRSGLVFHLTLTYFWLQLVDLAVHSPPHAPGKEEEDAARAEQLQLEAACEAEPHMAAFRRFLVANRFLADDGLPVSFYSHELIFRDPRSPAEFVLPDLRPLPSILSFSRKTLLRPPRRLPAKPA